MFTVLMAGAKRLFHDRCVAVPDGGRMKREAVQDPLITWEDLPNSLMEDGWGIDSEEQEPEAAGTQ
jgi:hypothetical protein